ncbi:TIGR04282 family arsenosugar biosynthesis glycosyltransferase [Synechococcus sp. CS-1324]|uniref:TIGR04282 family arsenosugar biosynthesis glycosyltransferase n=1 Tax=Synechococcus sp. CS-1324 TaxID=2847980 RepID=UPI000DB87107|nr:TIGR04282 family arsenosugar biosynthesis glycosyltransferase [Synechococcus sp. CS-1324]MCT0230026.1 TIGR04282 family arsenosugar biosynthesis glycosyltransferase [Synechococcus sp. CS-1324]PZV05546.1 MAG: glycosyltransferase [Cyanobium sp.]
MSGPSLCRIVILAKAPVAGSCKTRLIPALGAEGAAALARAFLLRTVDAALAAGIGPVELCVTPPARQPIWATLPLPPTLAWSDQGPGDLGRRMEEAAVRTLAGGERVILIGTDCPALGPAVLRQAAADLIHHDASIVPTFDGGYALLALRRQHPTLFRAMPWSTDAVLAETRSRLAALGWSSLCQPLLHDIDVPADLCHLPMSLRQEAIRVQQCLPPVSMMNTGVEPDPATGGLQAFLHPIEPLSGSPSSGCDSWSPGQE